jgi:hypothetical protein
VKTTGGLFCAMAAVDAINSTNKVFFIVLVYILFNWLVVIKLYLILGEKSIVCNRFIKIK